MKDFIDRNRQTGSTSALIKAAIETNGYLVVGNLASKQAILRNHRELNKNNVFTCSEIERSNYRGRLPGAVFFDATAIIEMQSRAEMTVEKKQPLTLIKVGGNPTPEDLNNWREMLSDCSVDPDFKIFSHQSIEIEQIPYKTKQDHKYQLNIKLTDEDVKDMEEINKDFFDGEANDSMMGRIILRKGMAVYRKLKNML